LNDAAIREAARQVRLRHLGGLVAIDCVTMRAAPRRRALEAAAREAFRDDPWGVTLAPLSRFGVIELARAQRKTPLHELLCESDGAISRATLALAALRRLERDARAWPGRRMLAGVSAPVMDWLAQSKLDWRSALTQRIGPRFDIAAEARLSRAQIDVRPAPD